MNDMVESFGHFKYNKVDASNQLQKLNILFKLQYLTSIMRSLTCETAVQHREK